MKVKKEIAIAIVVGCIMLLVCVIVIVSQKNIDKPVDLKVYKLYEKEAEGEVGYYSECSIDTEDILKVKKEFNRMNALKDTNILTGKTIKGSYKVIMDGKEIAFDNSADNMVYNGSKNRIYSFTSEMYEIIINTCG